MPACTQLILLCRPGFEKECAAEILEQAGNYDFPAYIRTTHNSAYVQLVGSAGIDAAELISRVDFTQLVFTRQWFAALPELLQLPETNRLPPLLAGIEQFDSRFSDIELDYCDTNEGKSLSRFCRQFRPHLVAALKQQRRLSRHASQRLHVLFLDSQHAFVGHAPVDNSSHLAMGIPRLRMPAAAPSRSTLKLEEALLCFFDDEKHYFKPGMRAADLGAAPGGWSWQLAKRGLSVIAVDNGPMDETLMQTGMVEHIRSDAFTWLPDTAVDWMVCDMAERPLHVTRLVLRWLTGNHCRHVIYNIKLPMKKRWQAVKDCYALLAKELNRAGIDHRVKMKQLYHDREEITVCITRS